MSCRYTKVRAECGSDAANWQKYFSQRLSNVVPNVLLNVVHPDGINVTSLEHCDTFKHGNHQCGVCLQ